MSHDVNDEGDDALDFEVEVQALASAARALLDWEEELGGRGFPIVSPPPLPDAHQVPTGPPEPASARPRSAPPERKREAAAEHGADAATATDRAGRVAGTSGRLEAAGTAPGAGESAREHVRGSGDAATAGANAAARSVTTAGASAGDLARSVAGDAAAAAGSSAGERGSAERSATLGVRGPSAVDPEGEARARLVVLGERAAECTACRLHEGRTRSVFARGSASAELAFVGEGPGYNEDQVGLPFVGPAGQLLDKMVAAMGFSRDEVYVCNVVKCRPPNNRTPQPDEVSACASYLRDQLELVRPRVIVALGRAASEGLGVTAPGERGWRGRWGAWEGVPVMSTFHPAYLLRSPEQKRPVWEDLQAVVARLGRRLPTKPAR